MGKQYGQNVYDGTFTLNSKNFSVTSTGLAVNNNGVKVGGISNAGVITGTGLTIKDGSSTGVSISKTGNIKAYDGMTITDKSLDGLTTATTTTAYNGISNKIERLDGDSNKLYSTGTTVTVNAVTTTAQGDGKNGISGDSNKTTSTVSTISGVTDTIYDADGSIVAKSVVSKTNIQDSFIKNGVTYSVTTNGSGTTFRSTAPGAGTTVINGGTINASGDVKVGNISLKDLNESVQNITVDGGTIDATKLAGINRENGKTTIEGTTSFNKDGMFLSKDEGKDLEGNKLTTETTVKAGYIGIKNRFGDTTFSVDHSGAINAANGKFTVDAKGNTTTKTVNGVTIETYKDTVRSANDLKNGDILIGTPDAQTDADKINLSAIDRNTAGISRDEETTTIDGKGYATIVEGKTVIGSDGSFSTAGGRFTVEKDGRVSVNGSVNASGDVVTWDGNEQKYSLNTIGDTTAGIERKEVTTIDGKGNATVIEGKTVIGSDGSFSTAGGRFTVEKDGRVSVNGSVNVSGDVVTWDGNEQKYSLNTIGETVDGLYGEAGDITKLEQKTDGIERDGNDITGYTTSIETTFRIHSPGVSHNVGTIDIYGDMIQATNANGQKTIITGNGITTNELTVGGIKFGDLVNRVEDLEDKTQNITPSNPGTGEGGSVVPPTTDGQTGINGDVTVGGDLSVGGNLTADSATIGGVTMKDNTVTATTGNFDNIAVGGENGTTINKEGITVGKAEEGQSYTSITKDDVKVTDSQGNTTSLTDVGNRVTGLESSMNNMNNRLNDVEDRIDKVGAMSAAIANLRTMGFDPEAPTEIAIGVGQYKSETGLALGVFHYPNQDFMLSASISTSGDEVMGGIGATWKLGRKSAAEKAKDEEARRLEKAEEMKKLAQDAKVKAQAERHAKLLAEREAQKTA